MSIIDLNLRPGETETNFINRLGSMKDSGLINMTWEELANIFNKVLRQPGEEYGESAYRKKYAAMKKYKNELGDSNVEDLVELRRELEKEKVKFRDERNEYNRLIREEARRESFREQFIRAVEEASGRHALDYKPLSHPTVCSDNDMIIALTDIHAGINIDNFCNNYNEDVLRKRLNHYLDRIFEIRDRHNSQDAYVVVSESISGLIHQTLRIQSNQDVIEQFLMVTDYICDFLLQLSARFANVNVYVAPGNHSRVVAKKDQSVVHENLDNLIIPFLRAKLQNFDNIHFYDNNVDPSIVVFPVRYINVAAVHGDRDSLDNVADNLSKLLRVKLDLILTGHRHTNRMITSSDVKVVQSGCLSGSDEYALNARLRNRPEQVVCIISETEGLDCIYDIKFD